MFRFSIARPETAGLLIQSYRSRREVFADVGFTTGCPNTTTFLISRAHTTRLFHGFVVWCRRFIIFVLGNMSIPSRAIKRVFFQIITLLTTIYFSSSDDVMRFAREISVSTDVRILLLNLCFQFFCFFKKTIKYLTYANIFVVCVCSDGNKNNTLPDNLINSCLL